jgi:hypothetical protein
LTFGPKYRHTKEAEAYEHLVHPLLVQCGILPPGRLEHAEGSSQDVRLGIDWSILRLDGTGHGLATRVQGPRDYGTFSIRYRTEKGVLSELTKRYRSVMSGGVYPDYTIQAYVDFVAQEVVNAYVVRTRDLYEHCIREVDGDHFTPCGCVGRKTWAPGGAEFLPVAITEQGKARIGTQATLIGHGVAVRMASPRDVGPGLWTP